MLGCYFSMFSGWVLVGVTQALALHKVVAELVLLPWVLRAAVLGRKRRLTWEESRSV